MRSVRGLMMVCAVAILLGGPSTCCPVYGHDGGPGLSAAARAAGGSPVGVGPIQSKSG